MQQIAHGVLSFERAGAATVVGTAYARSPLRLLTPRNHGPAAWAYTSTLGGGLVDGDRIRLRISVAERAVAFVSTQGPTRVFRSVRGCEIETTAQVAAGGASVALWDVLSAGRIARGERWALDRCSLALTARREGRTFLDECWLLDPSHGPLGARLGRFEALATVLLAGPLFTAVAERWREELDSQPQLARAAVLESASALEGCGVVVRLAAESVEELVHVLRARAAGIPALLGDDPWARRA